MRPLESPSWLVRPVGLAAGVGLLSAGAGLEAVAMGEPPFVAAIPSLLVVAVLAARAVPAIPATAPLELGSDLEARPSPGRGLGLFASSPIKRGTYIMDYDGERLTEAQLAARKGDASYQLELRGVFGEPSYVDARDPAKSTAARYINHSFTPNLLKRRQRWPTPALRLFAARDVSAGEELFFDYGADYWTGRQDELV
ncbi:hypothetical protein CTAYLR_009208 [Chrysophaeum taylorii]|uniref:SET domain-containing protein n=1 Tax=Chrysophaeum taylorii TaxID=2483200 RepID=A0AAD7U9V0_9STRA|nr:hypothetical protein CTAYLR_009208 [Chrysophaeum taylorii]